jgi:hypothetical protein
MDLSIKQNLNSEELKNATKKPIFLPVIINDLSF